MRKAIVKISLSFLHDALKLPPNLKITHVRQDPFQNFEFEILIEGESLRRVSEGAPIPTAYAYKETDSEFMIIKQK